MAELDAVARLRIVSEGQKFLSEVADLLGRVSEESDRFSKEADKAGKSATNLAGKFEKLDGSLRTQRKATSEAANGFKEYTDALGKAQAAQRRYSQSAVQGQFDSSAIPALAAEQMTGDQRRSLLSAYEAQTVSVISKARELEAAEKGVTAAIAQRVSAANSKAGRNYITDSAAGFNLGSSQGGNVKAASAWLADYDAQVQHLADKTSPRLRYALYDVASTASVTAVGLAAVGTAVVAASASFESSFTDVERTLDGVSANGVAALRDDLIDLTREIPLAFSDISQIATLGNQLGISADQVSGFSKTVAQFATVSGMTVEASAEAFGSLDELLPDVQGNYDALGSAIALVGRKSVATESEIVSMTTRLAASASKAGFTAQEVVALSGALASLRVAPERAQGVMEVYFNRLNTAIAENGDSLKVWSAYTGVATDELREFASEDPVGLFTRLSTALGTMDSVSQTSALAQLGLDGIRAGEVFGRVAANVDVFNQAIADSNTGYSQASELASQYEKKLDDLSSKWQIMLNAIMEAAASAGDALTPVVKPLIDQLTQAFQMFADFAKTDIGQSFIKIAGGVGAVITVLAALAAGAAIAGGSLFAIRLALVELGIIAPGVTTGLSGVAASLVGVNAAASSASFGIRLLRAALVTTGIGAIVVAAGFAISALTDFGGTMYSLAGPFNFIIDAGSAVIGVLAGIGRSIAQTVSWVPVLGDALSGIASLSDADISGFSGQLSGLAKTGFAEVTKEARLAEAAGSGVFTQFGATAKALTGFNGTLTDGVGTLDDYSSGLGDVGDSAAGAAKEIRTLADYASDLSSVMSRAFEIRWGPQQALDGVKKQWIAIADANADAAKKIADYKAQLRSLQADRDILEYQLRVAVEYKDTERAAKIREELADIDTKRKDTQADLTKEQKSSSKALKGNSKEAIDNRSSLLSLVQGYQGYLTSLASSGASQATLTTKSAQLKEEFVKQATQLGYNNAEVRELATSFNDYSRIVRAIPPADIKANTSPALTALAEYEAKLKSMAGKTYGGGTVSAPKITVPKASIPKVTVPVGFKLPSYKELMAMQAEIRRITGDKNFRVAVGNGGQGGQVFGFAGGGYTGNIPASRVAGVVHGNEYVFSAPAVRNAGVNNLAHIHEMLKGGKSFAPSGGGGLGGMDAGQMDYLARRISYYSKDLTVTGDTLRGAVAGSTAAANRQGRG